MRAWRWFALPLSALCMVGVQAGQPAFVFGAYKHLPMWKDGSNVIIAAHDGVASPYIVDGKRRFGPGALSWAFASGECGDELWGEEGGAGVAAANVAAFDRAGVDYIVSTGGAIGAFTCASDAGMERFIARYQSPHLVGIDFDIEGKQTAAEIESLVRRARHAQRKWPRLRFSFTVATHAASDGSRRSLNATGETILKAVRRVGLRDAVFNLMVMDYGAGEARFCVVKGGVCDMGASAIQAARNVHGKYGIPYAQIELTAMIGVNDVVSNVFTLDDARTVADAVKAMKLAGLHYWSLDRDTPCSAPTIGASPVCSTLDVKSGEYGRALGRSMP
jgi:chitinase